VRAMAERLRVLESQVQELRVLSEELENELTTFWDYTEQGRPLPPRLAAPRNPFPAPTVLPRAAAHRVLQDDAENKLHMEAMRYARLLVSEIELYHKIEVELGRSHHDLYARLKPQIERSREAYQRRFAEKVGKAADYFHEEVLHTLAHNDLAILGAEYPGPSA
jgi:hypothetical protein